MNILFIAPLPPPITGHALAAKVILEDLSKRHRVHVVNLSKNPSPDCKAVIRRVFEVVKILGQVWRKRRGADIIYLTISESFVGNIKDLIIYLLCIRSLSRMYIHLHGGSIKKHVFDRYILLGFINRTFIANLAGVIVSGQSHLHIFDDVVRRTKMHVIPNFAEDHLFASEREIVEKFAAVQPVRILYLSSLQRKKGYRELVEAYLKLDESLKRSIRIDFAGRFDSEDEQKRFLGRISGAGQIYYHGVVDEAKKRVLFSQAHIFCLPSRLLEGQPISILEAYASGCVVLTTCKPGILDIFRDAVNGFEVGEGSTEALVSAIEHVAAHRGRLLDIAIANRAIATENYRTSTYIARLREVIESPIAASRTECN